MVIMGAISGILDKLNEEQIKPVLDTDGAVLVIAGAGSGKTRVLTSRIAYLIKEKRVSPYNILAITFTNKAADEMKDRLAIMVGGVDDMWVSTIHGMCARILRRNIPYLGYETNFTIYSENDRDRVIKRIVSAFADDDDKLLKNAKYHISNAKTLGLYPKDYYREMQDEKDMGKICSVYEAYEKELKECNALDFDDLLIKTRDLLQNFEEVRSYYSNKFAYIHIDEFQDTNAIQYEIVCLLAENHGNIFAVGDDDQSIYGWRGAQLKNILNFEKDFSGARVYKLERNYRSTKRILSLANAIIKNNTERKDKVLWTENKDGVRAEVYTAPDETNEAMYTAIQVKNLIARGYRAKDFAVLMRINALSRSYEQEFMKYGIPYKVFGGFKFFERKEIKDLLAYFRILVNPLDNDAILRVINVPKRGIGEKTIELLMDHAENKGVCLYDSILDVDELDLPASTKGKIKNFKQLIVSLMVDKETKKLTELLQCVLEKTGYMSLFQADSEDNYSKKANIGELQNSIEDYCRLNREANLSEYISSVTLSSDTDEMDDGNYVTIATIHSVKGLEFNTVFICGLEETVFPISRASNSLSELEEERRLMYVAITRAQERLFLTCAQSRYLFGERQYTIKSRFLGELAAELGITVSPQKIAQRDEDYGNRPYRREPERTDYSRDEQSSSTGTGGFTTGARRYLESQKPKVEIPDEKIAEYAVGMKVLHQKFGEGIIISLKGTGSSTIADVAFGTAGVKKLAVKFAPMKIL